MPEEQPRIERKPTTCQVAVKFIEESIEVTAAEVFQALKLLWPHVKWPDCADVCPLDLDPDDLEVDSESEIPVVSVEWLREPEEGEFEQYLQAEEDAVQKQEAFLRRQPKRIGGRSVLGLCCHCGAALGRKHTRDCMCEGRVTPAQCDPAADEDDAWDEDDEDTDVYRCRSCSRGLDEYHSIKCKKYKKRTRVLRHHCVIGDTG